VVIRMTRADKLRLIADDSVRKFTLSKGPDTMEVSITEDGRYRADVRGSISSVNHGNADTFLREIASVLGGVLQILKHGHGAHSHTHTHGGTTHSH
jgi:hypothetical protein